MEDDEDIDDELGAAKKVVKTDQPKQGGFFGSKAPAQQQNKQVQPHQGGKPHSGKPYNGNSKPYNNQNKEGGSKPWNNNNNKQGGGKPHFNNNKNGGHHNGGGKPHFNNNKSFNKGGNKGGYQKRN